MKDTKKKTKPESLADVNRWIKVVTPEKWVPQEKGDILQGYFGGEGAMPGRGGERYPVWFIHSHTKTYYIYGKALERLMYVAQFRPDEPIKIEFKGMTQTANGEMRTYEIYRGV